MADTTKQTKRDAIAQRRVQVAALRLAHLSQPEIARQVGVALATVNADLQALRKEWAERRLTSYEEWLEEELAKLDRLERSLLPLAIQGKVTVVDRVLAIMDRRAKLLGLDAPELHRHTIVSMDAVDAEIERLERALADSDSEAERAGDAGG